MITQGEGPDWGVVNATGTHLEALRAAESAVTAVRDTNKQPNKDSQDGLRLIEALEAAEAAFDSKHAGNAADRGRGHDEGDNGRTGNGAAATDTVATSSGANTQGV